MAKLSTKVAARITTQLKRYQSVLSGLLKRDVSEADTVTVVNTWHVVHIGHRDHTERELALAIAERHRAQQRSTSSMSTRRAA